jgi:hypothetical protein
MSSPARMGSAAAQHRVARPLRARFRRERTDSAASIIHPRAARPARSGFSKGGQFPDLYHHHAAGIGPPPLTLSPSAKLPTLPLRGSNRHALPASAGVSPSLFTGGKFRAPTPVGSAPATALDWSAPGDFSRSLAPPHGPAGPVHPPSSILHLPPPSPPAISRNAAPVPASSVQSSSSYYQPASMGRVGKKPPGNPPQPLTHPPHAMPFPTFPLPLHRTTA